ncbi:hypothetical protein [Helicobacter sp. T3_23-1056]
MTKKPTPLNPFRKGGGIRHCERLDSAFSQNLTRGNLIRFYFFVILSFCCHCENLQFCKKL